MPVAFPDDGTVLLVPPDAAEAAFVARGVAVAVAPSGGLTPLQVMLLRAFFESMTGHVVDPSTARPIDAAAFAEGLARRNRAFRTRVVQIMLLAELILRPLPAEVAARVEAFADELGIDDDMLDVARRYAAGSLELAEADFARNGYLASIGPERLHVLHTSGLADAWGQVVDDPGLAAQWQSLGELPVGTLGRGVYDFYRDRGFTFPGRPGSAPPLLAQHDWVHVLAGYGTALESEIEVFGYMSRANDDPRAFSLLAMVVSLFETGYLARGAGLFEADAGHLHSRAMAVRLADAMRRGALCTGSHDFLEIDWFTLADRPLPVVRDEAGLTPKSDAAIAAGSAGPWQPGGISDYQLAAARAQAAAEGREYVQWQPAPERD
ncbi:MAG TPA: hypothetical protein VH373_07140 [Jatrophihabitantaceae bacterium]|jgi:hypothetical protein